MAERHSRVTLQRWSAAALALLLILAAVTDRNAAYGGFHAAAAGGALLSAALARGRFAGTFLVVFGVIDLYQAVASMLHWFPEALFHYSPTDDVVHWFLGAFLVLLGSLGRLSDKTRGR